MFDVAINFLGAVEQLGSKPLSAHIVGHVDLVDDSILNSKARYHLPVSIETIARTVSHNHVQVIVDFDHFTLIPVSTTDAGVIRF
ncbi:hypothetical protein D3C87_2061960 [compost metagenome]